MKNTVNNIISTFERFFLGFLSIVFVCFVLLLCFKINKIQKEKKDEPFVHYEAYCKDLRDGEIFYFNSRSIKNLKWNPFGHNSLDITTHDGKEMKLHSGMESWLKCGEVNHEN